MGNAPADLPDIAHVDISSGGDWPQFEKQIANSLPARANMSELRMMLTSGAKLLSEDTKQNILTAFDASLEATGFTPEETWGERIEDRGRQITSSALG